METKAQKKFRDKPRIQSQKCGQQAERDKNHTFKAFCLGRPKENKNSMLLLLDKTKKNLPLRSKMLFKENDNFKSEAM